jgi:poly(ADP-ribose) glycohydrolase
VGDIKIDFANRYIGGGCLTYGCVQEEIMFAVRPELLAATQLCQKMKKNEALAFIGFPKHFRSKGYGTNNTHYNGF